MQLRTSNHFNISKHYFGQEQAPLLIVDDLVEDPDALVTAAKKSQYIKNSPFYPGPRSPAPLAYQQLILSNLEAQLVDFFQLPTTSIQFSVCHFSVITTPPHQLKLLQRIPHFDSLDKHGLAAVHYLFQQDLGGTSFYRHRKTGFESIDEARHLTYLQSLEAENEGPNLPKRQDGYINGDTPLFERIAQQPAVFNRLIIYRRNSLHSASIPSNLFNNNTPYTLD
ncbi:DUF6445 family protein [Paraglaciecola aquimarina]|uniref:DUF6445 family protein n=1 Tax=Paraglaciecola aquimarina TaxID=1235557 RepID=A0ABU3SZQ9_9ALTE|nr:DUF6445 family protein [Paraglaciecola aquimarina]MDU0355498.1 DUF6445 family protein [Paraglaciecola aquimarina]